MLLSVISRQNDNNLYITKLVNNEIVYEKKSNFRPSLYIKDNALGHGKETVRDLISKDPLHVIQFKNIIDYNWGVKKYNKQKTQIFNAVKPEYQYIVNHYHDSTSIDIEAEIKKHVKIDIPEIWAFDIETNHFNGRFAKPQLAQAPITLIQLKSSKTKKKYIFGYLHTIYKSFDENTTYIHCENEEDMLKRFTMFYRKQNIVVLTAWFGQVFDFPYLSNRINQFESLRVSLLSKFGETKKARFISNKINYEFEVPLESIWVDYVDVYKKVTFGAGRESWALDFIAKYHKVDGKLNFVEEGFENIIDLINGVYNPELDIQKGKLFEAYENRQYNPERFETLKYEVFVRYGELDVDILDDLEVRLKAFNSLFMLSRTMRVNLPDTLTTILQWQIFSIAMGKIENIALQSKATIEKKYYGGGFVFSIPKLTSWAVLFDYNSLYPNTMVQYNYSPDTIVYPEDVSARLRELTDPLRSIQYKRKKIALFGDVGGLNDDVDDVDNTMTMQEDIYINFDQSIKDEITSLLIKEELTLGLNGVFYTTKFLGFYPKILSAVYYNRTVVQAESLALVKLNQKNIDKDRTIKIDDLDLISHIGKILMNSLYGALASKSFVISNYLVGESITSMGRYLIKTVSSDVVVAVNKFLANDPIEIVQIDTDSYFTGLNPILTKAGLSDADDLAKYEYLNKFTKSKMLPIVNKSIGVINKQFNATTRDSIKMGCEIIAKTMISTGKKRYMMEYQVKDGVLLSKSKSKITGIETKRSDTPNLFRSELESSLSFFFKQDESGLQKFIANVKSSLKVSDINLISKPSTAKDMTKYKDYYNGNPDNIRSLPMHYRASIRFNELIAKHNLTKLQPIDDGDKIKYFYLKDKLNKFGDDVIAYKSQEDLNVLIDMDIVKYIDFKTTFEKGFIAPIKRISDVMGYDLIEDKSKKSRLFQ